MQKSSPRPARSSVDFSTRARVYVYVRARVCGCVCARAHVIFPSADDWYIIILRENLYGN